MKHVPIVVALASITWLVSVSGQEPRTEVTKWQDGKLASVSITFDDSTINQFRMAVPLMNERGLPGDIFRHYRGNPWLQEPPHVRGPADHGNHSRECDRAHEQTERTRTVIHAAVPRRSSAYRGRPEELQAEQRRQPDRERGVRTFRHGSFGSSSDWQTYAVGSKPPAPVRSQEEGRPSAVQPGGLTWEELRKVAAQGHEIANHLVSHAHTPGLDEANIRYEAEKADEDLASANGSEAHLLDRIRVWDSRCARRKDSRPAVRSHS